MKVKIKAAGIGSAMAQLRSIGQKVPDAARSAMRRSAQTILENARAYAPEDFGNLANAIHIVKDYGYRGRLEIDIDIIPTGRETTKPRKLKGAGFSNSKPRQIDVLQYALLVHENYETHVAYVNGPGERTKQKMAANPGKVGSGFLRRAAEEEREKLTRYLIATVNQIIERERQ
ncbi:MAG: hypothetical protein DI537_13785 [Stutzerimonas stutzeri]|nr:MAG: hypothetical protein DI537_13785 [Stutzerimonas stutzeri]